MDDFISRFGVIPLTMVLHQVYTKPPLVGKSLATVTTPMSEVFCVVLLMDGAFRLRGKPHVAVLTGIGPLFRVSVKVKPQVIPKYKGDKITQK